MHIAVVLILTPACPSLTCCVACRRLRPGPLPLPPCGGAGPIPRSPPARRRCPAVASARRLAIAYTVAWTCAVASSTAATSCPACRPIIAAAALRCTVSVCPDPMVAAACPLRCPTVAALPCTACGGALAVSRRVAYLTAPSIAAALALGLQSSELRS